MEKQSTDWRSLIAPVFLAIAVMLVYSIGLQNELIFDDGRLTDGTVRDGYASLLQLKQRLISYGSFNWLAALVGENWPAQRALNVLLHLATCVALHQLFSLLLQRVSYSEETLSEPSFMLSQRAALRLGLLVFALNPVAVYAVAYLIQRSVVMATLFGVLACWAFARGLTEHRARWHLAAFASLMVAVLSKEHAVLFAALSLPLYIFLTRPTWKRASMLVGGVIVFSAAALALLLQLYPNVLGQLFDETSRQLAAQLERQRPGVGAQMFALSLLNQAALFFYYGALWFAPYVGWMSIDMRPPFPLSMSSMPHLLGAAAYVIVLVASAVMVLRKSDVWGFIGLCLLFPLVLFWTEFATVWVQDPMVLYRSYLWAIPIPGLVAVVFTGFSPGGLTKLSVLVAMVLAALTAERVTTLKSDLTVWSDAIQKIDVRGPANAVGRYRAFLNRGAYHLGRFSAEPAIEDFRVAQALGEPTGGAIFNAGVGEQLLKRHADALKSFALAEAAGYKEGPLYFHRGESQYALAQFDRAIDSFTASLAIRQAQEVLTQAKQRRAESAMQLQRYAEAVTDFESLLAMQPKQPRFLAGLGLSQIGLGKSAMALETFNQMIGVQRSALAFYGRALANAGLGNRLAALEDIGMAAQMEPGNAMYRKLQESWKAGGNLSVK